MFFLLFLSSTIIVSFQMHCFCSNMLKISFTNEFNFDVWENEQKEKSKKYWLKLFSSSDTCREFLETWDTDLKYIWNCTVHTSRCIVCTVPFNRVRTHGPSFAVNTIFHVHSLQTVYISYIFSEHNISCSFITNNVYIHLQWTQYFMFIHYRQCIHTFAVNTIVHVHSLQTVYTYICSEHNISCSLHKLKNYHYKTYLIFIIVQYIFNIFTS